MRKTALIAMLVPLSLLAAACGDSKGRDLSAEEQEFADSIAIGLPMGDGGIEASDDDIECMAEAVVVEIGVDTFEEAGVEPEDFESDATPGELLGAGTISDADAGAVVDEWQDCTDMAEVLAASSFGEDEDAAACFAEGLDDELLDIVLIPAFTTEDGAPADVDEQQKVIDLFTECSSGSDSTTDEGATDDGGADTGAADTGATDIGAAPEDMESLLVASLSAGFASSGVVDEPTAQCLAEGLVERVGAERLLDAVGEDLNFEAAPPEMIEEIGNALQAAGIDCDVPPEVLNG